MAQLLYQNSTFKNSSAEWNLEQTCNTEYIYMVSLLFSFKSVSKPKFCSVANSLKLTQKAFFFSILPRKHIAPYS